MGGGIALGVGVGVGVGRMRRGSAKSGLMIPASLQAPATQPGAPGASCTMSPAQAVSASGRRLRSTQYARQVSRGLAYVPSENTPQLRQTRQPSGNGQRYWMASVWPGQLAP